MSREDLGERASDMSASSTSAYTYPVSAWFRVLVGLLAIPAALAAGLVAWAVLDLPEGEGLLPGPAVVIVGAVCGALSLMLFVWAFRLLTGRARAADQGLLSPMGLRAAAVYFAMSPILLFIAGEGLDCLAGAPVGVAIALACWRLASVRSRPAPPADAEA